MKQWSSIQEDNVSPIGKETCVPLPVRLAVAPALVNDVKDARHLEWETNPRSMSPKAVHQINSYLLIFNFILLYMTGNTDKRG